MQQRLLCLLMDNTGFRGIELEKLSDSSKTTCYLEQG